MHGIITPWVHQAMPLHTKCGLSVQDRRIVFPRYVYLIISEQLPQYFLKFLQDYTSCHRLGWTSPLWLIWLSWSPWNFAATHWRGLPRSDWSDQSFISQLWACHWHLLKLSLICSRKDYFLRHVYWMYFFALCNLSEVHHRYAGWEK